MLDLDSREKKVAAFAGLVRRLPRPNLALLSALSQYLIEIVNNSEVNKMTIRNVGIVFAPTLNIPAPVFSTFLTDYDKIFGAISPVDDTTPSVVLSPQDPLTPEDIRSPRHQMFSDLPTPAYAQVSFGAAETSGHHDPREMYDTGFVPMQPGHEQNTLGESLQYGSVDGMLAPSSKSKRRESNLLFMMNNRKSSAQNPREGRGKSLLTNYIAINYFLCH